jgi:hypothetical protein
LGDNPAVRRFLLVLSFLTFLSACDGSEGESPAGSPPEFKSPGFPRGSVLFVRGTSLRLFDATSKKEEEVVELGTSDATVSPDGSLVAYVTSEGRKEDFVENPELNLLEIASSDVLEVGPGFNPSFSPDGRYLTYFEPVGQRNCEGEVCSGKTRIMSGTPGGETREMLSPGRWVSLGWAGNHLIAVDQNDPSQVRLVGPDVEPLTLDLPAAGVWGGSPAQAKILLVGSDSAAFRSFDEQGLSSETKVVAFNGSLGQGAWSPDGSAVASVLVGKPRGGIPATELALIAVSDEPGGSVRIVPGSRGAAGQVVWSEDGNSIVYARAAPPKGLNLEAVRCDSPLEGPCTSLFSWPRGVALLHLY